MVPTAPPPQLLTIREAAERLRVSVPKVWNLVWSGDLASLKIGKSRRVSEAQLAEFVRRLEEAG